MTGKMTLAWEGDQAADATLTLNDDMTKHINIVFETRSAAPTAAGYGCLYEIPVAIFKQYFQNTASPLSSYCLSPFDNTYGYVRYVSDTQIYFDFATTARLRRIWFMD